MNAKTGKIGLVLVTLTPWDNFTPSEQPKQSSILNAQCDTALLLKIVATRGEIFSLKFTKYRSAAGLRPDPLGEVTGKVLPQTP